MTDINEVLASRRAPTASRTFLFDGALRGELLRVRAMLDQARALEKVNPQGLGSEADKLTVELRELAEKAAEVAVVFTCRAVDADWLDDLKRRHPPSDDQMAKYKDALDRYSDSGATSLVARSFVRVPTINPDTAGPELLAESMVDPEMNVDQAKQLWSTSRGQRNELWNFCWDVQEESSDLPFSSAGIATTSRGAGESNTPVNGESPSQNSKDE